MTTKMYAIALVGTLLAGGLTTTAHAQSDTSVQLTDAEQSALSEVRALLTVSTTAEPQADLAQILVILNKFGIDTTNLATLLANGGDGYFFEKLFKVVQTKYVNLTEADLTGIGGLLGSIATTVNTNGESALDARVGTEEELMQELTDGTHFDIVQKDGKITITSTLTKSQLDDIEGIVIGNGGIHLRLSGEDYLHTKVSNLKLPKNAVATRSGDSKVVMHYSEPNSIVITSNTLNGVVISSATTTPFKDVPTNAWYGGNLIEMYNIGLVSGVAPTKFSPNTNVTRAQFVAVLARALELKAEGDFPHFSDAKGKWYAKDVVALSERGLLRGIGGDGVLINFGGDTPITREQAVVELVDALNHLGVATYADTRTLNYVDNKAISQYARESVAYLAKEGVVVSGKGLSFNPSKPLTRAQMTKLVMETLKISDKY